MNITATVRTTRKIANHVLPAMGSRFPHPFRIVNYCPVRPVMTIAETIGADTFVRPVKRSVFRHAVKVHGTAR